MSILEKNTIADVLFKPLAGTILAVASGLSFFFLCMILPLVGPSGSKVDHAMKNKSAFLAVLLVTFALAAMASYSKMGRRKIESGPLPWFSLGLCGVCILALFVLLVDGFAI
jgi:tellurite resistance protein TehA-like permease